MTQLLDIPVAAVSPGDNDRKEFNPDELAQLAASIDKIGLAEPIVVRPVAGDEYRLIAGERRWRAHQLLGRETIPALVRTDLDETGEADVMLAENTGRVDLGIMEEARAYAKRVEMGQTVEEIAEIAGVAEFRVRWRLDLLTLSEPVQAAIDAGQLTPAGALELRKLDVNRQLTGLKAWMANPAMGAVRFRRLTDQMLKEQNEEAATPFAFGYPDDSKWVEKAKQQKTTKKNVPTLVNLVRRLVAALENEGVTGPLLEEAHDLIDD